jgi:hypothetical protein
VDEDGHVGAGVPGPVVSCWGVVKTFSYWGKTLVRDLSVHQALPQDKVARARLVTLSAAFLLLTTFRSQRRQMAGQRWGWTWLVLAYLSRPMSACMQPAGVLQHPRGTRGWDSGHRVLVQPTPPWLDLRAVPHRHSPVTASPA